jgi:hypothetical protein
MQDMPFTRLFARKDCRRFIEGFRSPLYDKRPTRVSVCTGSVVCWLKVLRGTSGANFTAYQELKKIAHRYQPDLVDLPSYQHMVIGLISGAMGPFSNAPIDTIKTRKYNDRASLF